MEIAGQEPTMTTLSPIIATNEHSDGFDLVLGTDITGPVIGSVHYDAHTDPDRPGYVLRIADPEWLPDTPAELVAALASFGYTLTPDSLELVERLADEMPSPPLGRLAEQAARVANAQWTLTQERSALDALIREAFAQRATDGQITEALHGAGVRISRQRVWQIAREAV